MESMKISTLSNKTYYHGTARKDLSFKGLGEHWRGGIYFTPDHAEAVKHARMDSEVEGGKAVVIHATLSFSNPKKLSGIDSHELTPDEVKQLQSDGFDAIVNGAELAVFDKYQITVTKVETLDKE
jgi:hypothetical protein